MTLAVEVSGLVKEYGGRGGVRALDGVDLQIPAGTVMCVLGPNGAGKTTTVRIISTLLKPTSGSVRVAGVDVLKDPMAARHRIGLSGQYAAVDENLTGFENLRMVARLYGMTKPQASARARELISSFQLEHAAERRSSTYSGGMRRRLDLAGALVARPKVVVLDEPTTGLDPRGRQDMWQVISELVEDGTSVLLTTQYLEEADFLADRITLIDKGRVIAQGSAEDLKSTIGGETMTIKIAPGQDMRTAHRVIAELGVGEPTTSPHTTEVSVIVADGTKTMVEVLRRLDDAHVYVVDANVHKPSLDDVFLSLTGQPAGTAEPIEADRVEEAVL
ncbi:MAG: ATP-binding cassette domain-containing protein [Rhodococcus fascians]